MLTINITIPDEGSEATVIVRKGDFGAVNTLPVSDFDELVAAATSMLANIIANPPNIPAPPAPVPYTPKPKFDHAAEVEKLLPKLREIIAAWDWGTSKITVKNMMPKAYPNASMDYSKTALLAGETVLTAALGKLVTDGLLIAGKFGQFSLNPDYVAPPPVEIVEIVSVPENAGTETGDETPREEPETDDTVEIHGAGDSATETEDDTDTQEDE